MCLKARHGILPKTYTSSRKKTRLQSTIPRRNGYSQLRQQKSRKTVNSAVLGDHEDIKKSDDGDDGQRRGANKRRSDRKCQTIGFIRDDASGRKHPQFFPLEKHCEDRGYTAVRNHISSENGQENQLPKSELRTIRCPWSVDEFLYFIFICFVNIFFTGFRI